MSQTLLVLLQQPTHKDDHSDDPATGLRQQLFRHKSKIILLHTPKHTKDFKPP